MSIVFVLIEKIFFILHVVDGFYIFKQTKDIVCTKQSPDFYQNSTGQISDILFSANPGEHS